MSTAPRLGIGVLLLSLSVACARDRGPAPAPPSAPKSPTAAARAPHDVVRAYLTALEEKDYRAAYGYLTSDSRSMHSFDEFRTAAEEAGPVYDLDRMEAEDLGGDKTQVSVQLAEDPAVQSFLLKRENRQWRIVFHTGSPAAPAAD